MYELLDAPEHIALKKVFPASAAGWGTFLGGPLAGGYIIAHNFRAFGRYEKITTTWVVVMLVLSSTFILPRYLPFLQNNSFILSIMIALGAKSAIQYGQTEEMNAHLASGGELQPWWVTLMVSLLGLVVTLIVMVLFVSITDPEGFKSLMDNVRNLGG